MDDCGDMGEPAGIDKPLAPACIDCAQRRQDSALADPSRNDRFKHCCALFEHTGTASLLIAPDMTIVRANTMVTQSFGYAREEVLHRCFLDFLTPEYREFARLYHDMVQGNQIDPPKMLECQLYDKQGKVREVMAQIGWVGPDRHAIISLIDFTANRAAERERHRLSEVVEQSSESTLLTEVRGQIVYVNKAFETLSGYSRDEMLGRNFEHPFFSEQDRLAFKKMGFSAACEDVTEHRTQNTNRHAYAVSTKTRIAAICDNKGRLTHLVCTKKDITRETQFEQQLYESQKMEAIGTLSSGIAHDFNNILGGIMGYAEMAIQPSADQAKVRKYMTRILQACERARDLTSQILAFSRQKNHEYQAVQIQPLVNEALKLLRASTPTTIEFRKSLAAAQSAVMADPTRIHQIIMNLCTNASQAMESDGGILEVRLENVTLPAEETTPSATAQSQSYVMLSVHDTGAGIDAKSLEHIFE
ncbi:MAG: PAS domain S-box protein, partial [Desulfobacteraceae bacterium]|nr:PAS domain S-box protein [Desulfobacteraceae bacterium]